MASGTTTPSAAPAAIPIPTSTDSGDIAIRILIPLYSYPNWYDSENYIWDDVAAASDQVSITAIINPSNGPGDDPSNSDYQRGLTELREAGITILGYIYTDYGTREANSIKADVDLYVQCFGIDGIFFDGVASGVDKFDYYKELYNYAKSRRNLGRVFLGPGTRIDEVYFSQAVGDTIVVFEDYSEHWPSYRSDAHFSAYSAERLAILVHTIPDTDTMRSHIDLAVARNIGYVYLTDDTLDNPWDSLPTFWHTEIDYIASLNGSAP